MEVELIDDNLLSVMHGKAEENERLRMNHDLRTTQEDTSQRMLNVLLPGTDVPIHRHPDSSETVIILKGWIEEVFYDENGKETERFSLNPSEGHFGIQIPMGRWHTVEVHEESAIVEMKNGKYVPLEQKDIWHGE